MRKGLLLIAVLLLYFPNIASAQIWNIFLAGGIGLNSIPNEPASTSKDAVLLKPNYGIGISRIKGKFEFGLKISVLSIASKDEMEFTQNGITSIGKTKFITYYAQKAFAFTPFLNYYLVSGTNNVHVGINAGIAPTIKGKNDNSKAFITPDIPEEIINSYESSTAFIGGIQFGYYHMVANHFTAGIEVSPNYFIGNFNYEGSANTQKISVAYISGLIKLGYKF